MPRIKSGKIPKRESVHLTEEEKRMVAENHNLIMSYAIENKLEVNTNILDYKQTIYSNEDWYGVLAWGLCYAVKTFNPEKGNFSSYAYAVMKNEVKNAKRYYRKHNPIIGGNLQAMEEQRDTNKTGTAGLADELFYEKYLGTVDAFEGAEIRAILEKHYKRMGKYENLCRNVLETGALISDESKKMGVSRQAGQQQYTHKFLEPLRAELQEAYKIN